MKYFLHEILKMIMLQVEGHFTKIENVNFNTFGRETSGFLFYLSMNNILELAPLQLDVI